MKHALPALSPPAESTSVPLPQRSSPSAMNVFRILGDISHLLAIIILLVKMQKSKSCAGECSCTPGKEGGLFSVRGAGEMGAKTASNSPCKLAALPSGLTEGSHPPLGGLPGRRRGLRWKDVMWQGARPHTGVGGGAVKEREGQQGQREVENECEKLWQHQNR